MATFPGTWTETRTRGVRAGHQSVAPTLDKAKARALVWEGAAALASAASRASHERAFAGIFQNRSVLIDSLPGSDESCRRRLAKAPRWLVPYEPRRAWPG